MVEESKWKKHVFVFEMDRAIRSQVIEKLEASPRIALSENVAPPLKGVYALYRKDKLVYSGKALHTTLRRRLAEHTMKIKGRKNVSVGEMSFRFLTFESDWLVWAAEETINEAYTPDWNRRYPSSARAS
jgi:hypothetical protein